MDSEMLECAGRIESSFTSITNAVTENRDEMGEIAKGIHGILDSMTTLSELSVKNALNMKAMDAEISKFKTE